MEGNHQQKAVSDLEDPECNGESLEYRKMRYKKGQNSHELSVAITDDEQSQSKFSFNESISKISRKFSVSNESMASMFSRKGSVTTSESTISFSSNGTTQTEGQSPLDSISNQNQIKNGFNNTVGKFWSKKGPLPNQQQQKHSLPMPRNRSNSTPTSLHSNSLSLPRKLSISGTFRRITSNPITQTQTQTQTQAQTQAQLQTQQQHTHLHTQLITSSSRSSSTSISTTPDFSNDIPSTTIRTPVQFSNLIVNTNTTIQGGERTSPVDVIDIADEYFFRNPSMTINEGDDIDQDNLVSPNTFHSSQFNLPEHNGWALQDGVLISQDDIQTQLQDIDNYP